jgi:predicted NUDIX family NTP pyrophosphohydrolase
MAQNRIVAINHREGMGKKVSAGILLYRIRQGEPEVFLVHPGGPYWKNKDDGAWSLPKGECDPHTDLLGAARREFLEETGLQVEGEFRELSPVKQLGGKVVHAWAVEGDYDPTELRSNTFTIEWPPRSGRQQEFPEVDRGGWFTCPAAREKLLVGQRPLVDELKRVLQEREI